MTHVFGNCIRRLACAHQYVIYVHAIRYVGRTAERTAVDIKAHTPLIRFVVDLLYNKLWTCRGCCGYVVGVLYLTDLRCAPVVQCTWRLQQ